MSFETLAAELGATADQQIAGLEDQLAAAAAENGVLAQERAALLAQITGLNEQLVERAEVEAALRERLTRYETLIAEKDAEIAHLRALLEQTPPAPTTRVGAYLAGQGNPFGHALGCERLFDSGAPATFTQSAGMNVQGDTEIVMISTKHPLSATNAELDRFLASCPDGTIVMFQHEPERSDKNIDPAAWIAMQRRALLLAENRRAEGQSIEVAPCFTGWSGDPTNKARQAFFDTWLAPLIGRVRLVLWDPYWWADKDGNAVAGIRTWMAEHGLRWGIAEIGWDAQQAAAARGIPDLVDLTPVEMAQLDAATRDRAAQDLSAATTSDVTSPPAEVVALFHADGTWGSGSRFYRLDPRGRVPRPQTLAVVQEHLAR